MKKLLLCTAMATCMAFCSNLTLQAQTDIGLTLLKYTLSPADGQEVTSISKVSVTFPDPVDGIELHIMSDNLGKYVTITAADNTVIKASKYTLTGSKSETAVIEFPEITAPGTYTFNMEKGVFGDYDQMQTHDEGEGYSVNPPIKATYTIPGPKTTMSEYVLTPESGSTLAELKEVTVSFPATAALEGIDDYGNAKNNVKLYKGEEIAANISSTVFTSDFAGCRLIFDKTITEAGEYTLVIPADTWRDYTTEGDGVVTNPEIRAKYTIKATDGIDSVSVDSEVGDGVIFDLFGRNLGTDKSKLTKGIYIIDGKKTAIR